MRRDPNQTKTVVILLVVLAGAIGVTVVRVMGSGAGSTPATPAAIQRQPSAGNGIRIGAACDLSRNPFDKPRIFQAAMDSRAAADVDIVDESRNVEPNPYAERTTATVEPLDLAATPVPENGATGAAVPVSKPADEQASPRFELLATMKGSEGWTAVIKTDQSDVRVVELNDTVGAGFRVIRIETGRAVLTDGRTTVSAKRPRS